MEHKIKSIIFILAIIMLMFAAAFLINGFNSKITGAAVVSPCSLGCVVDEDCDDNNNCTEDICTTINGCNTVCKNDRITDC